MSNRINKPTILDVYRSLLTRNCTGNVGGTGYAYPYEKHFFHNKVLDYVLARLTFRNDVSVLSLHFIIPNSICVFVLYIKKSTYMTIVLLVSTSDVVKAETVIA